VDTALTPVSDTDRPLDSFAQVRSADFTTRYIRVGAGQPVVIVDSTMSPSSLWPDLLGRLAEGRRVIVPEVHAAGDRFVGWLRSFLDGMGLPPVTLVATGELCVPALEFALLEPERIQRLVLVPSGNAEETGLASVMTPSLGSTSVSMLVVRRDCPAVDAVALIERFLRGEMP
jgi:pimeloyl-ACP methyl ester carboxylesterase